MHKALLWILMLVLAPVHAQDIYYYGSNGKPLPSEEGARVKKEVRRKSDSRQRVITHQWGEKGWNKVLRERITLDLEKLEMVIKSKGEQWIPSTLYRSFERSGPGLYHFKDFNTKDQLMREGSTSRLLPLHLEGSERVYGKEKQVLSIAEYADNQLQGNQNWLVDGSKYIDSIFFSVDEEPEFKPGDAFFNAYVLNGLNQSGFDLTRVSDVVVISWVIMEDGTLEGVHAAKGKSLQLNQLLCDIIASLPGAWEPARLDGQVVRYYMSIPINFIDRSSSFQELEFSSGMMHYNKY